MNRRYRLTKSADFKRVRRLGRSYPHPLIVLIALPNELLYSRIAVVAGRTVGKAVERNRAKRMIRAVLNEWISDILPGWDLIFIARQPLSNASYYKTHEAIRSLLQRAQLIAMPQSE